MVIIGILGLSLVAYLPIFSGVLPATLLDTKFLIFLVSASTAIVYGIFSKGDKGIKSLDIILVTTIIFLLLSIFMNFSPISFLGEWFTFMMGGGFYLVLLLFMLFGKKLFKNISNLLDIIGIALVIPIFLAGIVSLFHLAGIYPIFFLESTHFESFNLFFRSGGTAPFSFMLLMSIANIFILKFATQDFDNNLLNSAKYALLLPALINFLLIAYYTSAESVGWLHTIMLILPFMVIVGVKIYESKADTQKIIISSVLGFIGLIGLIAPSFINNINIFENPPPFVEAEYKSLVTDVILTTLQNNPLTGYGSGEANEAFIDLRSSSKDQDVQNFTGNPQMMNTEFLNDIVSFGFPVALLKLSLLVAPLVLLSLDLIGSKKEYINQSLSEKVTWFIIFGSFIFLYFTDFMYEVWIFFALVLMWFYYTRHKPEKSMKPSEEKDSMLLQIVSAGVFAMVVIMFTISTIAKVNFRYGQIAEAGSEDKQELFKNALELRPDNFSYRISHVLTNTSSESTVLINRMVSETAPFLKDSYQNHNLYTLAIQSNFARSGNLSVLDEFSNAVEGLIRTDPSNAGIYRSVGSYYLSIAKDILQSDQIEAEVRGQILTRLLNFTNSYLDKALEINPNFIPAYFDRAETKILSGRLDNNLQSSVRLFEEAIEDLTVIQNNPSVDSATRKSALDTITQLNQIMSELESQAEKADTGENDDGNQGGSPEDNPATNNNEQPDEEGSTKPVQSEAEGKNTDTEPSE